MKYKKNIFLLYLLISFFLIGCKCESYFSNSDNKTIEEKLFNLECHLKQSVINTQEDRLEVTIDFKDQLNQKATRKNFNIYPIVSEKKDTLKALSNYASIYSFEFKDKSNIKIDLIIKYVVDSTGNALEKKIKYENLKQIKLCRYYPILH